MNEASRRRGRQEMPPKIVRGRPGRPTISDDDLLETAADLFLEHGFEGTSIDAITVAAGMSKRTIYMRYGDKSNLFSASLTRAIHRWTVPVERLQAVVTDDLEESLLNIGQILVANVLTTAGVRLMRLVIAETARLPQLGTTAYRLGSEPTAAFLADMFRRRIGHELANFPNADIAAHAYLHLVIGGPANSAVLGLELDPIEVDRFTRHNVQLFLHGLLSRKMTGPAGSNFPVTDSQLGPAPEPEETTADPGEIQELQLLESENRRLKKLLVTSMLEIASLKERLEGK